MYVIEEHYYNIIYRLLFKILGIWPYDGYTSRLVLLRRVLIIILLIASICLQLLVFITSKFNMAIFIKTMSFAFPGIAIALIYCYYISKLKSIKNLHNQIHKDWKTLRDKIESEIIQKYAYYGQYYSTLIFFCGSLMSSIASFVQFFPKILDIVSPLDESRPLKIIVEMEYFVSQDKYIFIIVLHQFVLLILYWLIVIGTTTQLMMFCFHLFGMFKIISYRVRYSVEDSVHVSNLEKEHAICKNITYAVIAHRRAMQLSDIFVSLINVPCCIIFIVAILSLSVNLFKFLKAITIKDIVEMAISFAAILTHLIYFFVANYIGQKITDYNDEIFTMVYGTSWYLMPILSQKLILFLLQKTGKEYNWKFGFIIVAKVETFTMLLNSALSYVTVMYSVQ